MLTRVTQTPERGGVLAFILFEGARDSAWARTRERTRSWGKRGIGSPERISALGAREGCRGERRVRVPVIYLGSAESRHLRRARQKLKF